MKMKQTKGKFERYEKRVCVLIFLSTIPNSFSGFQFLATHYTPPFDCSGQNVSMYNNLTKDTTNIPSKFATDACLRYNSSSNHGKNRTDQTYTCKSFKFKEDVQTVSTEFQLVCDRAWIKPMLTSLYMVGKMAGGLSAGYMSDRFGRRIAFLVFTYGQFVASILTSFSSSVTMYAIFMVISGLFAVGNFEVIVVLGTEMVSIERRSFAYFCAGFGFSIGNMLLALLTYLFVSWRWFLVFGGLVGVLYIPYFWLIDESPIWLLATGQKDKAEKVLRKIATYNGHKNANNSATLALVEQKISEDLQSETMWSTLLHLRKSWILIGRLAVVLFSWNIVSMTYYAIALNNDNLSGDRYLNIFYGSLTEMGSTFVFYFGITHLGRRNSYMTFMFITSAGVAAAPFLAKWQGAASVTASMLARLTIAVAFNTIYTHNGELFPTNIRTSILALSSGSSRIGGMIAPVIIYAGESGDTTVPSICMAVVIFLSALFYLLMPETKKTKLPQTIEEARNLNKCVPRGISEEKTEDQPLNANTVPLVACQNSPPLLNV
uniref:Organic cation transporter protein-like n=1 Tax=Phallusia mammillata TaxID=59560 RepID=A0A6F9DSK1_9ASCI|nr:organic cation transporter protein-like [Phallusia mammillata]